MGFAMMAITPIARDMIHKQPWPVTGCVQLVEIRYQWSWIYANIFFLTNVVQCFSIFDSAGEYGLGIGGGVGGDVHGRRFVALEMRKRELKNG